MPTGAEKNGFLRYSQSDANRTLKSVVLQPHFGNTASEFLYVEVNVAEVDSILNDALNCTDDGAINAVRLRHDCWAVPASFRDNEP
jgi:hypothetical protein